MYLGVYLCVCICVCDCVCFCVRLCVPTVFPSPRRPEENTGCTGGCDLLHMGSGSLQEQHIFLTPEPSLYAFLLTYKYTLYHLFIF